jgi:hypothetical protein
VRLPVTLVLLGVATMPTRAQPARPAETMRDLQSSFAACFHPPREADGTRLTFYFSLDSNGQMVGGKPRAVAFGFTGSEDDRNRLDTDAEDALTRCWPLSLSTDLASTIPGNVYFLQFQVDTQGKTQVLFRPFGSHVPPDEYDSAYSRPR